MKKAFVVLGCLPALFGLAQVRTVDVSKNDLPANAYFSVGGEPFVNFKFVRLTEGSPYFKDEWLPATGLTANNARYKARRVKLDLLDGGILYLDSSGREMIATSPLKQLTLTDSASNKSYHFVHASLFPALPKRGWYWQLASGKAALYCYPQKNLTETQPYGSATKEQRITTNDEFYLAAAAVWQIKKPADVLPLLPDKRPELEAWLKTKSSKGQSTAVQLTALVDYYNSLQ